MLGKLQTMLVATELPACQTLMEEMERVWGYVLDKQLRISLKKNSEFFSIKVDGSGKGMGYILYVEDPTEGAVVGLRSKGSGDENASSYLGELRGVYWALEDTKKLVRGHPIVLWTDSESVYQRIAKTSIDPKKLLDVRVSQMLAWIWANFSSPRLSAKFLPGQYNKEADILSRWRRDEGVDKRDGDEQGEDDEQRGVETKMAVNVSANIDEYSWNVLYNGHMGLAGMLHRRKSWGLLVSKNQLERKLQNCETYRRNWGVNRDTQLGP